MAISGLSGLDDQQTETKLFLEVLERLINPKIPLKPATWSPGQGAIAKPDRLGQAFFGLQV